MPSLRIVDLARAMAPHLPHKVVGIRPGEKLHEVMCSADDSHLTLDFSDHYVLRPSITFYSRSNDFHIKQLGAEGVPVPQGFEYSSGTNTWFLTIPKIVNLNELSELPQGEPVRVPAH